MSAERLVVIVQASTGMRGPQRTAAEFAVWLAGRRDVLLAAPEGWVLKRARKRAPGIETLALPGRPAADRAASARALASVAAARPVLFHANGLSALHLVAPAALRRRAPVLVHFHAFELSAREHLIAATWLKLGLDLRIHAVSDYARGLVEATPLRRASGAVLPNPFDPDAVAGEREPGNGRFRIGFVGGSDPRKGLRRLIDIAAACVDLDVEWHLFGIASDRHERYVESCRVAAERLGVADRLRWMGTRADPRKLYSGVDAIVIASELESFCRVAVEAMLAGLPLVATRIQGLSEIVWDGTTGLLFDPADPAEGAAHVRRIVSDAALRDRLAGAGRTAAARFEIAQVGPRLERLYDDLLDRRTRHARPAPAAEMAG